MRKIVLAAAAAMLVAAPAVAVEPKAIFSAAKLKAGQGALRLSVQSQVQQGGTIHLWFLRDGGNTDNKDDVLKFERKQGVPLVGTNTVDSRPFVFAVAPGKYRLIGYGVACAGLPPHVACAGLPPPGTTGCLSSVGGIANGEMPARRYGGIDVPTITVVAGQLTDAGEFILEAPVGTPIGERLAVRHAIKQPDVYDIRVRPLAIDVPAAFSALPLAAPPAVPSAFVSRITCRARPAGAMMYVPFAC